MNASPTFDSTAHKLLEELDARHEQLLAELDALNARVDAVLSQYVKVAPATEPSAALEPEDAAVEVDDD